MSDMSQTPLMKQYYKIKEKNPDTVLLFRIGDFFETFEDDAKTASSVLGITLTKRSNGAAGDVPLAGFPHHAIDTYLPKLVKAGYRVAICEQMEDPKTVKGIVKREVIEVVTPGVVFSDKLLDHKKNNYLSSVHLCGEICGFSFCDISTGEFYCYETPVTELFNQIELINPAEILVHKNISRDFEISVRKINPRIRITKTDGWIFEYDYCRDTLLKQFGTVNLKGFGIEKLNSATVAAGVVMHYLFETQLGNLSHLNKITQYNPSDFMILDHSTKRNLEIVSSFQDGGKDGTLFSVLDKTRTAMGGRMLKKWLSAPLRKYTNINRRLDAVEFLHNNESIRLSLIYHLKEIGDLERLISRICTSRAVPRELQNLKFSLFKIPEIKKLTENAACDTIAVLGSRLVILENTAKLIDDAIEPSAPSSVGKGDVIREGFNQELDELRRISGSAKDWVAEYQKKQREITGISSLRVSFNKVFGYYIEISNANLSKVPESYIRKQTLTNGERYITPELKDYEDKILNAAEKIEELETRIFDEIRSAVASETKNIQLNADLTAMLDCFCSFAQCAFEYGYVKPEITEGNELIIKNGRHPVVEQILGPSEKFTPNDCCMDNEETGIIILTGPNMAGKSVFLRQAGLIVLMAQSGSFVPADYASIGLTDRIYTRVGASDNISAGESTFLVEMQEAAHILNNCTPKSLILLDELGRGTSTFDGISIAWAVTEYLHDNPDAAAKTIFATHYHELNEMASIFRRIKNFKVDVREVEDKVVFLHKVVPGGADHSYGIQVARMAGLPRFVTKRAEEILINLESKELTPYEIKNTRASKLKEQNIQYNLFEIEDDSLRNEINNIEIEKLTPIEALNRLNDLKKIAGKPE